MLRVLPCLLLCSISCTLYLPGDDSDSSGGCEEERPPCLSCGDPNESLAVCVEGQWECPITHCVAYDCDPSEQTHFCVFGCGGDFSVSEECVDGAWQCPAGTQHGEECPEDTCWGIPPLCCIDGQYHQTICDGGEFQCLPESESQAGECESACPAEEAPTCLYSCSDLDPAEPLAPHCIKSEFDTDAIWQCPEGSVDASTCPE